MANTFRHDTNTRVTRPTKVASPVESEQHVRLQDEVVFSDLPSKLANDFLSDPIVLTCGLFFIAYVVGQMVVTRKDKAQGKPLLEPAKKSYARRAKHSKSHVAIAMNQQIIALQTPEEVLEFAVSRQKSADIVNVVTAIHRCAKLSLKTRNHQISSDPRIRELLAQLLEFLDDSDLPASIISRAVGNTSWALAKLNFVVTHADEVVLDRLQQLFTEQAEHFRPEEVMNTVWAFTALGGEMKKEQERAAMIAVGVLKCSHKFSEFTLQQVVYFAWALARLLGFASVRAREDVMQGLGLYKRHILDVVSRNPQALTPKNVSMVSWAITHLHQRIDSQEDGVDVRHVLVTITTEAARRQLKQFCPGELASIIWALNKCNVKHIEFLDQFRKYVMNTGLSTYSSQDLANIVVTYVNLAPTDDFLSFLGEAVQQTAGSFNRLERAMVMAAFTQVPHITSPRFP